MKVFVVADNFGIYAFYNNEEAALKHVEELRKKYSFAPGLFICYEREVLSSYEPK